MNTYVQNARFVNSQVKYPRYTDRRLGRRRILAGRSFLPPHMRQRLTTGEAAVLAIVSAEAKRHGICDLSYKEIGDRAGVKNTTVRNAIRLAVEEGWLSRQWRPVKHRKSDTNVLRIISKEWRLWMERGPGCKNL